MEKLGTRLKINMPELPEVETIVRYLNSSIANKTIKNIRLFREKNILTGAKEFIPSLIGETFLSVSRRAKYLVFHLTNNKVIVSHLRMEGKYFLIKTTPEIKKHDLLIYDFTDGTSLVYNDVRKFGTIELWHENDYLSSPSLVSLGGEPFSYDENEFYKKLIGHKKTPIKEELLDQKLIVGIGNIYASEILFEAKINPRRLASDINFAEAKNILSITQKILSEAIKEGGSTIRSYHPQEGVSGKMQNNLKVYGKENELCPNCGTPIRRIFMGGRSTFYCPHCQKEPGHGIVIGITGPIAAGKSTVTSYLENKGYIVLDADKLAHESYEDKGVKKKLQEKFPKAFKKGKVDRKVLLELISSSKDEMSALNSIIHPYVFKRTKEEMTKNKDKNILIDMPLLLGSPLENECDFIIGVTAPLEIRKERLKERGVNVEKSLEVNSSFPFAKLKKSSTIYIETTGTLEELKEKLQSYKFL